MPRSNGYRLLAAQNVGMEIRCRRREQRLSNKVPAGLPSTQSRLAAEHGSGLDTGRFSG
jgi:hypothetical protein